VTSPIDDVAEALGYRFGDPELLMEALTHSSYRNEQPHLAPQDNERLEFLGDAVIDLVASDLLFETHAEAREGELTRRRADLVCEPALTKVAQELGLGPALRLGRGEERSGGRDKPRLLASALEACLGAVYLDGGYEAALAVGKQLLAEHLHAPTPGANDHKSRLQELTQRDRLGTPRYHLVRCEGPDHERRFHVAIFVHDRLLAEADGRSKLAAEQAAARQALEAWPMPPDDLP
jgi:ribonuclease III